MQYALSIKQPWASLILHYGKDIENRSWKLPKKHKGQRIIIHAGKTIDRWAGEYYSNMVKSVPRGRLIGEVTILDYVTESDSEWFEGPYGFVLSEPLAYKHPLPCKGQLGFFPVDLSVAAILALR